MKIIKDNEQFTNQIDDLENELDTFLNNAQSILGYEPEGINDTINELLYKNTSDSKSLANDMMEVLDDISLTEEFFSEEISKDDPFSNLYNEDDDF